MVQFVECNCNRLVAFYLLQFEHILAISTNDLYIEALINTIPEPTETKDIFV